jgi:hypothetical protein
MRIEEHGAGSVREQRAQIHVATFADAPAPLAQPAGGFSRRQAEPAREVAAAAKGVNVWHAPDHRRRHQQADPWHGLQTLGDEIRVGDRVQLPVKLLQSAFHDAQNGRS